MQSNTYDTILPLGGIETDGWIVIGYAKIFAGQVQLGRVTHQKFGSQPRGLQTLSKYDKVVSGVFMLA